MKRVIPFVLACFLVQCLKGQEIPMTESIAFKLTREGDSCYAAKNYRKAIDLYSLAFSVNSQNEELRKQRYERKDRFRYAYWIVKADSAFLKKDYETAARQYETAVNIFPEEVYPKEQREICREFIPKRPLCPVDPLQYYFVMADSLKNEQSYEEAKQWYKRVLEARPNDKRARESISSCDLKIWERDHLKFQTLYDREKRLKYKGTMNGNKYYTGEEYLYHRKTGKCMVREWAGGKIFQEYDPNPPKEKGG